MSTAGLTGDDAFLAPWRTMTLTGLLDAAARARPDDLLFLDGEAVPALTGRAALRFTAHDAARATQTLAHQIAGLGLAGGETVLVQMPNTVEGLLAPLAVQKAGCIPALLPVFADDAALARAISETRAAAIITIGAFAGLTPAERARRAAAASDTVRLIAAFGNNLPAGVIGLDLFETGADEPLPVSGEPDRPDAIITFDAVAGPSRALVHTTAQIVAGSLDIAARLRPASGGRLLITLPPSSLAGISLGTALPLLTGTGVDLMPLFDSCAFAQRLGDGDGVCVVLPAGSESAFRRYCTDGKAGCDTLVLVHRPQPGVDMALPEGVSDPRIIDVLCLGESAVVSCDRNGEPSPLLPSRVDLAFAGVLAGEAPMLAFVAPSGRLLVTGACAAHPSGQIGSGLLDTGYFAAPEPGGLGFRLCAQPAAELVNAA